MNDFENQKFCQSCAMPLMDDGLYGTNADGTKIVDIKKHKPTDILVVFL